MIEEIDNILKSFKIKIHCINYKKVRNISIYDLKLDSGGRVKDLRKYIQEIAIALKAKKQPIIRVLSDIGIVRLEVADSEVEKISFFSELSKLKTPKDYSIPMYLGSSTSGKDIWIDVARNPHLLLAGTTGSGKTTLLHIMIANALKLKNIKICLVDTKNFDFAKYDKFDNINLATDYNSSLRLLNILITEMDYRYKVMNNQIKSFDNFDYKFPNILFMIDEFADLILQDKENKFHDGLCKLAQKSRAAGIYCILATQRPSVNIISGIIKANFPARISCQVASGIDSRVILDTTGAELLAGNGDAIIKNYNNDYERFQSAFTCQEEVCATYGI